MNVAGWQPAPHLFWRRWREDVEGGHAFLSPVFFLAGPDIFFFRTVLSSGPPAFGPDADTARLHAKVAVMDLYGFACFDGKGKLCAVGWSFRVPVPFFLFGERFVIEM